MTPDRSRLLRRRRELHRGHHRAAARRSLARRRRPPTGRPTSSRNLHKFTLRWALTCGGSSTSESWTCCSSTSSWQLHLLLPGRGRRPGPARDRGLAAVCPSRSCDRSCDPRVGCHGPAHPGRSSWASERPSTLPYILGVQLTNVRRRDRSAARRLPHQLAEPDLALPLRHLSAALVGIMGLPPSSTTCARPASADRAPTDVEEGPIRPTTLPPPRHQRPGLDGPVASAVLPILWAFTLIMHFGGPHLASWHATLRFGGDVWWLSLRADPRRA